MGAAFVMIILFSLLLIAIALLLRCFRRSRKVRNIVMKFKKKLFWNTLLRTIITGYLKLSFSALAAIAFLSWVDASQSINSVISLVMLILMCQYPLSFGYLLHRKRKDLPKEEMKQKIGSLYLGMKTETWLQRLYSPVFMFRRLVYALLTVILADHPTILIHTFLACNLVYWLYLGYANPNDTKQSRNMEFFNEFGLQLITYNLAAFPHSLTPADELLQGWVMIAVIGAVFASNLIVMVITTLT